MNADTPSIVVAVPSLEKLTYAAKVMQESLNEPSPASTYGDTAVGDSVPATPQESGDHGKLFSSYLLSLFHVRIALRWNYSFLRSISSSLLRSLPTLTAHYYLVYTLLHSASNPILLEILLTEMVRAHLCSPS